jgi:ABC-type transporter Mla maintaining outer membrane lipid asymmetry ATPase subunit MlaF
MRNELLNSPLTNRTEKKSGNVFIEFQNVCKAFDDRVVLNNVSFKVTRGETCVIMGRSGVGKSVSLKHIMGFLKADSGQIIIDCQDVTNFTEQQFDDGISIGRAVRFFDRRREYCVSHGQTGRADA